MNIATATSKANAAKTDADETAPLRVAVLGHRLVVGRAGGRGEALGHGRDRGLLHPLRREARGLRGEIRLPRGGELRGDPGRPLDCGDRQHDAQWGASRDHPDGGRRRQARLPRQADRQHGRRGPRDRPCAAKRPASCSRSVTSGGARATSVGSKRRSTPGGSAGWCRRNATSAATASARSICRRGATRLRACRAASCSRSAFIMSTCSRCCSGR